MRRALVPAALASVLACLVMAAPASAPQMPPPPRPMVDLAAVEHPPSLLVAPEATPAPPPAPAPPPPPSPPPTVEDPAPPPPEPVRATGNCAGWEATIAAHFPAEQVGKACDVMLCETGGTGDPTIHNAHSSASGLWQFLDSTWRSVTGLAPPAANYSPDVQTEAAASLWRSSGWSPWSCA